MKLQGGCHCGAIRYSADDTPFHETVCHCIDCRRSSGAIAVAWFSVKRAHFAWNGTPAMYCSSPTVVRRFCDKCGTTLSYEDRTLPGELDIAIATLDEPSQVPPKDHVWVQQKPDWDTISGPLPQYGRRRK